MHTMARFVAGLGIENIVVDVSSFSCQFRAYNQILSLNLMFCVQRLLLELVDRPRGMAELTSGVVFDDEAFEEYLRTAGADMVVFLFWMYTSWARFYLGDLKSALFYANKCWRSKGLKGAFFYSVPYFFIGALTALESHKATHKLRYWRIFRKNHRELKKWAQRGNLNTSHVITLLDAELLAVRRTKNSGVVRSTYNKSIALASRGGFVHDAALANERAGRYFLKEELDLDWAKHYLLRAKDLYNDWGAVAKVKQMEVAYGNIAGRSFESSSLRSTIRSLSIKGRSQTPAIVLVEKALNLPLLSMDSDDRRDLQHNIAMNSAM
jgi:hypothetical protein